MHNDNVWHWNFTCNNMLSKEEIYSKRYDYVTYDYLVNVAYNFLEIIIYVGMYKMFAVLQEVFTYLNLQAVHDADMTLMVTVQDELDHI